MAGGKRTISPSHSASARLIAHYVLDHDDAYQNEKKPIIKMYNRDILFDIKYLYSLTFFWCISCLLFIEKTKKMGV
jgi:hypothetical protein